MVRISVSGASEQLEALASRLPFFFGEGVAPATQKSFSLAARHIQRVWQGWAMGSPVEGIESIKHPSTGLARSIRVRNNGPFDTDVFTESEHASRIQNGQKELDMKKTHPYGPKSRVSKKGIPYLIIPFRWGTPNQAGNRRAHWANFIPQPMYEMIKSAKFVASIRKPGTHPESNWQGEAVERSEYSWGDRVEDEGNIQGLVKMKSETRRGGSTYFTFRIISANSEPGSWIRPAVPAVDMESGIAQAVQKDVEDAIRAGLEADFGV